MSGIRSTPRRVLAVGGNAPEKKEQGTPARP